MNKSEVDQFINEIVEDVEGFSLGSGIDVKVIKDVKHCHCDECSIEDHPSLYETKIIIRALFPKHPDTE
jgi:hypothetical protein